MTALYPSTETAQVYLPLPTSLLNNGTANYITAEENLELPFLVTLIIQDPVGATIFNGTLNGSLPAGVTYTLQAGGDNLTLDPSVFTVAGVYRAYLVVASNGFGIPNYATFQWGGWIDTLFATQTSIIAGLDAVELQTDQTVAILSASYDVDDPSAPTVQTLSIGGSPIATRTIANADGSPINPAQVLILGELTAVP